MGWVASGKVGVWEDRDRNWETGLWETGLGRTGESSQGQYWLHLACSPNKLAAAPLLGCVLWPPMPTVGIVKS